MRRHEWWGESQRIAGDGRVLPVGERGGYAIARCINCGRLTTDEGAKKYFGHDEVIGLYAETGTRFPPIRLWEKRAGSCGGWRWHADAPQTVRVSVLHKLLMRLADRLLNDFGSPEYRRSDHRSMGTIEAINSLLSVLPTPILQTLTSSALFGAAWERWGTPPNPGEYVAIIEAHLPTDPKYSGAEKAGEGWVKRYALIQWTGSGWEPFHYDGRNFYRGPAISAIEELEYQRVAGWLKPL